jgi:hypothetical protein
MPGEWYVSATTPASPMGNRLASVEWDSVPPVSDLVPAVLAPGDWVALNVKLGRRGADRPILVGRDSNGVRTLITAGDQLWRWALRGGAAREAYRAVIAGGVDWLLGADAIRQTSALASSGVVPRGLPVSFHWSRPPAPDSVPLRLTGPDSSFGTLLRFDAAGVARLDLAPGVYRWSAPGVPGALGIAAVEPYSEEFRPRPVTIREHDPGESFSVIETRPREWWWLFLLAIGLLLGEWAWRLQRGLP